MCLDMVYDPPNRNPGKPWRWIIVDSLIIAAIAFVAALPQRHIPTPYDLYIALKAFLYAFLVQVAVERGIKPFIHRKRSNGSSEG